MFPETQILPDPAIFNSLDALDEYLQNIRTRREQRRDYIRLQTAINKVTIELEATLQDNDPEITMELQGVLQEFERRLGELQPPTPHIDVPTVQSVNTVSSPAVEPPLQVSKLIEQPVVEVVTFPVSIIPIETEEPEPPIMSKAEKEALLHSWLTDVDELAVRWKVLDDEGLRSKDGVLNRPACFRMRGLACSLARIQTEAENVGMASEIKKPANTLSDKMALARTFAGDSSKVLPFDENAWAYAEPPISVDYWVELEHLYSRVAEAQEIWEWFFTIEELGYVIKRDLLNAIGAAQQMVFRVLDEHEGRDWLQGDLYGNLRKETDDVGFLISLNPDTGWDDLDKMAKALPTQYAKAKHEVESAKVKREKEERKKAAIEAVQEWHKESDLKDTSEKAIDVQREKLLPILDECIAAGVPASNVPVRTALLNTAPILLKDLYPYAKFLDAVCAERKRKNMDCILLPETEEIEEEDDIPDAQMRECTDFVRLIVENQKVLILGGCARPQVAENLKDKLGCADVKWADSKKGDPISKFKTQIRHTDIVVLVKNYSSHEMVDKGRDLAKEFGKMLVLLPSGYGVNKIIQQMYDQLVSDVSLKKNVAPPLIGNTILPKLDLNKDTSNGTLKLVKLKSER